MLRIAKIVVIYKTIWKKTTTDFHVAVNIHIAYICCHELPRVQPFLLFCAVVGRGESGECNPSLFFQDNAACFPLIRHEILCSLCLFIFTIPIINFKIATLATNDM